MSHSQSSRIIDQVRAAEQARPISFKELLAREPDPEAGNFIRITANGGLPAKEVVVEQPSISEEELLLRRQEKMERETYQKVFAAAEKAGLQMGRQKMEQELILASGRMEGLIKGLEALPPSMFMAAEKFLVETAIILVRELLGHELRVDREALALRVEGALKRVVDQEQAILFVAPDDAELLSRLPRFERIQIRPDEAVSPGSFRLESPFGGVETDLSAQLADVEKALREHLRERVQELSRPAGVAQAWEALEQAAQLAGERGGEQSPIPELAEPEAVAGADAIAPEPDPVPGRPIAPEMAPESTAQRSPEMDPESAPGLAMEGGERLAGAEEEDPAGPAPIPLDELDAPRSVDLQENEGLEADDALANGAGIPIEPHDLIEPEGMAPEPEKLDFGAEPESGAPAVGPGEMDEAEEMAQLRALLGADEAGPDGEEGNGR